MKYLISQTDPRGSSQPLLTTPNRFTRTSQSAYWNTGNGSPDAVSFTVDQPGVVIAGVCIYGGSGQYIYEVELLDNVSISDSSRRLFVGGTGLVLPSLLPL